MRKETGFMDIDELMKGENMRDFQKMGNIQPVVYSWHCTLC